MSDKKPGFFQENQQTVVYAALTALVMVIYYQTIGFNFINLDDNLYVFGNQIVSSGVNKQSVQWAFTQFHAANWHPLSWISHMIDVEFFGQNPGGHHATNVVFHILNTILAFTVFQRMTGSFWKSVIVAALFAVHPAHVESVAWVSERKDVLSTFFWLLTMLAYIGFARRANTDESEGVASRLRRLWLSYLLVFALLALGLMAKPMLVTLPCVLLLMDYWSLERLRSFRDLPALVAEKIPLFALSAASSYITFIAQRAGGAMESFEHLPMTTRALNAVLSYAKYTGMLFYPAKLGVWYPYDRDFPVWQIAVGTLFVAAMTALSIWQIGRRKYLLMGWLWFLGTLVPVIGLVQVGAQPMADRYTYVPYFGLFIILVWGAADVFKALGIGKSIYFALFGLFIAGLTFAGYVQASYWKDNEILYKRTLAVTQRNFLISHNLCHHLTLEDRLDEAESFCKQSLADNPGYFEAYNTYGILLTKRKQFAEAEQKFKECLAIRPDYALAYSNMALAQILQGKPEEAEDSLRRAADLPGSPAPSIFITTLDDLASAYARKDNLAKAVDALSRLLFLAPDNFDARLKLALALFELKRYDESQAQVGELIRQTPEKPELYNFLGKILVEKKETAQAIPQFEKAIQLKPDFEEAKQNLKKAKGEK
ncbi:MAG: tetratricopeptide repeat protein [Acidobacteria bacterium]|nr:tetratricopeptide repeat protein [Acidobacteriota bacterium]